MRRQCEPRQQLLQMKIMQDVWQVFVSVATIILNVSLSQINVCAAVPLLYSRKILIFVFSQGKFQLVMALCAAN